jgi:ATP-binding cassette subfamily C protein
MSGLIRAVGDAIRLLPAGCARRLWLLVPLMGISAVFEMVGLGLILPLVNAIAIPDQPLHLPFAHHLGILAEVNGEEIVLPLAIGVAVFYLLKNALLLFAAWVENSIIMDAVARGASQLMRTYMTASYVFHLKHNSAELIRNINLACDDVFRGVLKPFMRLVAEGMIVVGIFTVLVLTDPVVTVAMGLFLGSVLAFFYVVTHRRITSGGRRSQALHAVILQGLNQSLGGFKEVRVRRCESFFIDAFVRLRHEMSQIQIFNQTIVEVPRLTIETLLVFAFVVAVVMVRARGGIAIEVLPLLALYALAGFRLMPTFNKLVLYLNTIRFNIPAMNNVLAHHRSLEAAAKVSPPHGEGRLEMARDVRIEALSYTYPGAERPSLDHIDLTVVRGTSIGLVGGSGAGKTTLADVILGLLEPQSGRLLVDGSPVVDAAEWQRSLGYVPQFIYLLDDSVRRNVAIGLADDVIDDAAVWRALEQSRLADFIRELPQGLDTPLGENGSLLSGGQRQRIGIARALYHQPQLLVLDEATSALDNATEREVSAAIEELAGQVTLVIIAHRLSTVRKCDVLYLLDHGRVLDCGSFSELAARSQAFREMLDHEPAVL